MPETPVRGGFEIFVSELRQTGNDAKRFKAIDDVSFSIATGDSVALIGRNGAGKSTILNLIAGLLVPDSGTIQVEGTVSSLLQLGAGFHPELTGRENLVINAALLGLTRRQIASKTGEIIEFSGLGNFVDQPIRTYSSGMVARLAFSTAVAVDPDILLVDEVLAVGDQSFQQRCSDKIGELKHQGKIFVCVTHDLQVPALCRTGIWIEQGTVKKNGPIDRVLKAYTESVAAFNFA